MIECCLLCLSGRLGLGGLRGAVVRVGEEVLDPPGGVILRGTPGDGFTRNDL